MVSISSKLSQDILALERDYKYNLNLLNTKHIEIDRCNKENKLLREILKSKAKEIEELASQFLNSQKALEEKEYLQINLNKKLEQKVIYLTQDIENAQQKFQLQIEVLTKKYNQLHHFYNNLLEKENHNYDENLKLLQQRHIEDNELVLKAKQNVDTIFKENLSLQNKIRKLDCKYITKTCFYENEFKKLRTTNLNLNTDIEHLKENHLLLQNICNELELENNNLKTDICEYDKKIFNLIKENQEKVKEICENKNDAIGKNKMLNTKVYNLILENQKMELRLNQSKKCLELEPYCNIISHKLSIDQNEILKQLVKKMRTERDELKMKNNELENRVDKIEKLIKSLK